MAVVLSGGKIAYHGDLKIDEVGGKTKSHGLKKA